MRSGGTDQGIPIKVARDQREVTGGERSDRGADDLSKADAGSGTVFGIGSPLVIGIGFLLLGPVLMAAWWAGGHTEFFRRRASVAPPGTLDAG